jgi:TM2 domain-containing membrane protein YozV
MKRSAKAALLSAFMFPGAGHFFLKRYIPGIFFLVTYILIISLILQDLISMIEPIIQQIEVGDTPSAILSMQDLLLNYSILNNANISPAVPYAFGILWFINIIDAYRIGLVEDKKETKNENSFVV